MNSIEDNGAFKPQVGTQDGQVPLTISCVENSEGRFIIVFIVLILSISVLAICMFIASARNERY